MKYLPKKDAILGAKQKSDVRKKLNPVNSDEKR
jgi:hypothetical protein